MQNKGAIRLFAIALAIVCVYQLSFTFVARKVEKDAVEYAAGDSLLEANYLDSIGGKVVYNILVRKYTYRECKEREINLGLDLKGGMNVTLEVSMVDMIRSLSNYSTDTTFNRAIALAREYQKDSQEDFITLFGQAFEEIDPNGRLAAIFATRELRGEIDFNSTNEDVLRVIRAQTEGAMDNAFNVLRNRIDRFGVVQPNIQRLETQGRILVELPGVKEPERVRKLLQGTANLEFWETYDNSEIFPYLQDANGRLKEILDAEKALRESEETAQGRPVEPSGETGSEPSTGGAADESSGETGSEGVSSLLAELDESAAADTGAEEELSLLDQIAQDSLGADTTALTLEDFIEQNPLLGILQPNVTRQGQFVPGAGVGFAHYKDTGKIRMYLNMGQIRALLPRDVSFHWDMSPFDEAENYYVLYALRQTGRDGRPPLDGSVVTNANVDFAQTGGAPTVTMGMNSEGAQVWARLTRENVGKAIAIVLDDFVVSAPTVDEEIPNGRSTIRGNFTYTDAEDLTNVLKSGKLPAPARIEQEAIVGPSLGKAAIKSGLNSFLLAFVVVMLYMVFYYSRRAGFVADIALISNMFFLIGVLASLGAVLTLPGIAGIVLTIGMSVDANVLIYERVREELTAGKGTKLAIADGYRNAYSAIIDANVTTLLTGIILLVFGTGPIKGFATTLVIGICTSLFSAIFVTRLVYERMLTKGRKLTFSTKLTHNAFKNLAVQFIERRRTFYIVSGVIILLGIVSLMTRGLNQGIDFTGGRTYVVKLGQSVNTLDVQKSLESVYGEPPQVITFGSDDQIRVTTKYKIDENAVEVDEEVERLLYQGLQPYMDENVEFETFLTDYRQSSQKVGPTIADDIKKQAVWAILFALIAIFIYILIRFRNWQFGMGAVAALVHDVLIVLGIFSIFYGIMPFSLEIDQAFIAAILTVVGYSINDTVVVFDRIREYVGLYRKRERMEIINLALNSTLSRTFSTSLSTFFVLLMIFLFGGEVIRGFTFALLIGVVVGTYSSLFIATPVVYDTILKSGTVRFLRAKKRS
jgi:SecD/SecF fusion protein